MKIMMRHVMQAACEMAEMSKAQLTAKRRTRCILDARHASFYLCREMTTASLPMIGRHFGGQDHTTVMNGVRRATEQFRTNTKFAALVNAIRVRAIKIYRDETGMSALIKIEYADLMRQKIPGFLQAMPRSEAAA